MVELVTDPMAILPVVRAWATLIFGVLAVTAGILKTRPDLLVAGFAVLGADPVARADPAVANGELG